MKTSSSVAASLVISGVSLLITLLPSGASNIECSELANYFANGDINFDENLRCRNRSGLEMSYGRYCTRIVNCLFNGIYF